MKSILKKISIGFSVLFFLVIVYGWMNYAPNKSLEELKVTWTYDNSKFIEIEGMPVHYRINGEGFPLVLIHGTGASLHTWEEWTKRLEKDFKVISLDMPAFGLTGPNPKGEYSLDFYARFLKTFLGKIGVEKCALAGNSLGGGIAWTFATLFPDMTESMILIDSGGYPRNKKPPLAFRLAKNKILSKILLTITPKSLFEKSMKEVYHDDDLVTQKLIDRYYELYLREGNRQAFVDRINSSEKVDPSLIGTIKTPTLIMWGKTDEWIPVEDAYKFENDIEGSELIIYEKVGHLPMEELPQQSAEDASKFLKKIFKSEETIKTELSVAE